MKIIISILFVLASMTASTVQSQDLNTAKSAVSTLESLSNSIPGLTKVIDGFNYGPFKIVTQCTICVEHVIWCVETKTYTYTWKFPAYTDYMDGFKSDNLQLLSDIHAFNQYYTPLRQWFVSTLPQVSQAMTKLHNSSPGNLQANLNAAISVVSSAKSSFTSSMNALGHWNTTINNDFSNINANSAGLQSTMSTDEAHIKKYMSTMACGAANLLSQWKSMTGGIDNQINSFTTTLGQSGISASAISQDLAAIQGPLVSILNELNSISNELNKAKITPNQAMKKLDSIIAVGFWNSLTQFVQKEFGNS